MNEQEFNTFTLYFIYDPFLLLILMFIGCISPTIFITFLCRVIYVQLFLWFTVHLWSQNTKLWLILKTRKTCPPPLNVRKNVQNSFYSCQQSLKTGPFDTMPQTSTSITVQQNIYQPQPGFNNKSMVYSPRSSSSPVGTCLC